MADDAPEAAADDAAAPGEAPTYRRPATAPKIKRMMQRDEDVGKISQYTPLALGRALELFVAGLTQAAAAVAKSRKSKMLTAAHLKAAVHADATLDFLKDTVAKAPELPAAAEGGGDSDGEGAKPKRVRKPRPKKAAGEADGSGSDDEAKAKKPRKRAPAKPKAAAAEAAAAPPPAQEAAAEDEEPAFEVPAAFSAAAPPAAAADEDDYDA